MQGRAGGPVQVKTEWKEQPQVVASNVKPVSFMQNLDFKLRLKAFNSCRHVFGDSRLISIPFLVPRHSFSWFINGHDCSKHLTEFGTKHETQNPRKT